MPKPISLVPNRSMWAGSRQWSVNLPAKVSQNGKRTRHFFETKQAALNYCDEQRIRLVNFGVQGSTLLSPGQVDQAANALELLKPHGVSLNEVVQEWLSRKQAAEASVTFEAAMDTFKDFRKRSDSYTRSIRQTKCRLTGLHGKLLNQITPEDLTRAMDGMTPSVHNFTIRILGGLFN